MASLHQILADKKKTLCLAKKYKYVFAQYNMLKYKVNLFWSLSYTSFIVSM